MPRIELTGNGWNLSAKRRHPDQLGNVLAKIWREMPHKRIERSRAWSRFKALWKQLSARAQTRGSASVSNVEISELVRLREKASGKKWSQRGKAAEFESIRLSLKHIAKAADERIEHEAAQVITGLGGL